MATTRQHPVPAYEMALLKERRGTTVNCSQPFASLVNVFKSRGGNYWQSRIPLHAGSFVSQPASLMANDKLEISVIVAAFENTSDDKIILCGTGRLAVCF